MDESAAAMQGSRMPSQAKIFSLFVNGAEKLPLRAGELVSVEVLSVGPNDGATVMLKNAVVPVQTDIPLREEDRLTLRVERQESAVYLRLGVNVPDERAGSVKGAILSAFDGFEDLKPDSEALMRLTDLLSKLPESLKQNLPEIGVISKFLLQIDTVSGRTMQEIVQNGGIFFETKLRILALGIEADGAAADIEAGRVIAGDLKASLLRLKDTLLAPAVLEHVRTSVNPDDLLGALNAVLRNIEFYQLRSKLSDSLQFFLPLVWKQLNDGEIILREYGHGEPGARSYACTINLELEGIGKIRVLLAYQAGAVHVTCTAEDKRLSELFRAGADVLEMQLRSSGLRLGNLSVYHAPRIEFPRTASSEGFSIRA